MQHGNNAHRWEMKPHKSQTTPTNCQTTIEAHALHQARSINYDVRHQKSHGSIIVCRWQLANDMIFFTQTPGIRIMKRRGHMWEVLVVHSSLIVFVSLFNRMWHQLHLCDDACRHFKEDTNRLSARVAAWCRRQLHNLDKYYRCSFSPVILKFQTPSNLKKYFCQLIGSRLAP